MKKAEIAEQAAASSARKWYYVDRNFLSIKLIYFWMFSGGMAVLPLLTLHMQHIGLTLKDVAQVYVFMPAASFMGPPIIGYIADRTGRIRELYVICLVSHCLTFNALFFLVPPSPQTTQAALQRYTAPSEMPCTSWSLSLCSNGTGDQQCRLSCPEALLQSCQGADCALLTNATRLRLTVGADGCRIPSVLEGNGTGLPLKPADFPCPTSCSLVCGPVGDPPLSDRTTFWSYFGIRLLNTFFLAPSFTLLDATNLALVKEFKTPGQNFGRQRVMAILASIVSPPLVGLLLDAVSEPGTTNFAPAFYVLDCCVAITVATLYIFKLRIALPEKAHIRQAGKVLKRPEALVFILVVAILGSMWGFLENFLFVFLRQLHAPNYLLGLTLTVAGVVSLPFNWWSDVICKKVGHVNILIIAFFGYAVRYIGYSFMTNPWLCMPFELMEVVTTHLMWNSAASYAGQLAPPGLLATLIGLAGALHYSFGRGVGSFVGGYLMALEGAVFTYRAMGVVSGVAGVLYMAAYYGLLRRQISQREKRRRAKAEARAEAEAREGAGAGPHELAAMLEDGAVAGV